MPQAVKASCGLCSMGLTASFFQGRPAAAMPDPSVETDRQQQRALPALFGSRAVLTASPALVVHVLAGVNTVNKAVRDFSDKR